MSAFSQIEVVVVVVDDAPGPLDTLAISARRTRRIRMLEQTDVVLQQFILICSFNKSEKDKMVWTSPSLSTETCSTCTPTP